MLFAIEDAPNVPNILYLDVQMKQLTGIDAANQLRKLGCSAQIIFLTNAREYVFDSMVSVEQIKLLLRCHEQKRLICVSLCLLLAYLIMESDGYYYDFPLIRTSVFHMITSVAALIALYTALLYAVDVSAYIEYELKTRQFEKQLQRQVVHYQQYTKQVNDLRVFKHDYKHMVETAAHLIRSGSADKVLDLLGHMNAEMDSSLQYMRFSNHVVVDAILRECAGRCHECGVEFTAMANLPERIAMNGLEFSGRDEPI